MNELKKQLEEEKKRSRKSTVGNTVGDSQTDAKHKEIVAFDKKYRRALRYPDDLNEAIKDFAGMIEQSVKFRKDQMEAGIFMGLKPEALELAVLKGLPKDDER